MPVTFFVKHLYQYPVEVVAKAHLGKYPNKEEANIFAVDTLQHRYVSHGFGQEGSAGSGRMLAAKETKALRLEDSYVNMGAVRKGEHAGLVFQKSRFSFTPRNADGFFENCKDYFVSCTVDVNFYPAEENEEWTVFEQHGSVDIHGLKLLGPLVERIALKFFNAGAEKGVQATEKILSKMDITKMDLSTLYPKSPQPPPLPAG